MLKKRKLGRRIGEIQVGEKLVFQAAIEDKDLLLYLGLTDDANPLYIQHDYASQTPFGKPVVPPIMLMGMITSAVSKYLPGPGSYITRNDIRFLRPVYHYETLEFLLEVTDVDEASHCVTLAVTATRGAEMVLTGELSACPPHTLPRLDSRALENF
ncbi:MaoC/PaaZ C-terminal domain-containing protein [Geobacillus sp. FSL W8-0032]|uniref:Enoyl-CoA hydratase n=1 Tax=Geobacillus subterraneus TaxID=129338 RepID=A0A679FGX5_9BACL|nr:MULTISPECIES: MaoC/PaaZ C-terminal domain-containing protein [Geobacillus]BBW95298.1 enoyl-CoA hydratase [Geobacillus subterraneus]